MIIAEKVATRSHIVYLASFAAALLVGCHSNDDTPLAPMNAEQVIRQYANSPVGDSIESISRVLATQTVFVGTEGVTPTQNGKIIGKIRLKTGTDKQGRYWVYAYTSQAEFHKAFPLGGAFAEMSFPDVFKIVEREPQFAGIYLNSASDTSYPIPRELFDQVRNALADRSAG